MFKVLVGAEYRINLVVVAGVVVVIALRLKDRIKINCGDSQLFEVVKLLFNAAQIAAKKVVSSNFVAVSVFEVNWIIAPARVINCAFLFDNLVAVAIKSVRENLIHDGMFKPIGSFRALLIDGDLESGRQMIVKFTDAAQKFGIVAVIISFAAGNNYKVVPEQAALIGHFEDERIKFFFGLFVIACREIRPLFARALFPRVQEDLLNYGVCFDCNTEPHRRASLCRTNR